MYYPIMFEPIYKQMIWGGKRFSELFGRRLPAPSVGESWDISCRPNEMGTVKNGRFHGTTFEQLIDINPEGYLGKALCSNALYSNALRSEALYSNKKFPLLVKLIDANDDLSVQVHPPGEKNEIWYIIFAPEGSRLNAGLVPGVKKEEFSTALSKGGVEKYLNFIPVKAGDVINIPAGTVHALGAGLVIAEIQQNSDTTFRVYDYGRVDKSGNPRQLHIAEALSAIDFDIRCAVLQGQVSSVPGGKIVFYCATKYYALYEYFVKTSIGETSDPDRFFIFTCVDGGCEIRANGYCATVAAGDSVFIPAALGDYEIVGKARLLKSFVPGV